MELFINPSKITSHVGVITACFTLERFPDTIFFPFHGHFASTSTKYGERGAAGLKQAASFLWDSNRWLEKKTKMERKLVEGQ